MKFFKQIKQTIGIGAESKSKVLMRKVMEKLEAAGLQSERDRNLCATAMFRKTVKYFRQLQKAALGKGNVEAVAKVWTDDLKATMDSYGIEDVAVQEEIIVGDGGFMDIMADLA